MTAKEYIQSKLSPLEVSDAVFADMSLTSNYDSMDEVTSENIDVINKSMIGGIEFLLFAPRVSSINESGFSQSWDYKDLGKLYLWLCRRYGVTPNDDALGLLDIKVIKNISNMW